MTGDGHSLGTVEARETSRRRKNGEGQGFEPWDAYTSAVFKSMTPAGHHPKPAEETG